MFTDYPDIIFVKDVCEILNISPNTAYELFRSGAIGGCKLGKSWFTTKGQLTDYVIAKCNPYSHKK